MRKEIMILGSICIVGILLMYSAFGAVSRFFSIFTPRRQPLTELYLQNSFTLPDHVMGPVPFSFAIRTTGATSSHPYSYKVYLRDVGGHSIIVDAATTTILPNMTRTISEYLTLDPLTLPVTVFVTLPALKEELHFSIPHRP